MHHDVLTEEVALALAAGGRQYRPTVRARARRLVEALTWTTDQGSALVGKPGDWVLEDGHGSWTVDDETFTSSYRETSPGTWEKVAVVIATQMSAAVDVNTREGVAHAEAGDWLVCGDVGGCWPISDAEFRRRYRPAHPEAEGE